MSSGDGYNRHFDEVLADFTNKERCVDDTCHYDKEQRNGDYWMLFYKHLKREQN